MLLAVHYRVMEHLGSLESTQEARVALGYRLGQLTGSPHIRLEQTTFIGRVLCFVSANFYYARGTRGLLVRGLEPKLRNRSEPARRSNIVTRDET